jgi:omega-amidase
MKRGKVTLLKTKIKVAAIQMDIALGDPPANRARAFRLVEKAARQQAKIILLPELWTTGYCLEEIHRFAETETGPSVKGLGELSRRYGITIAGSIAEKSNEGIFNTAYVVNQDGLLGKYRKVHLVPFMSETVYFQAGNELPVFYSNGARFAITICYDLRFPELIALLGYQKVDLYMNSAEFTVPRQEHWRTLLRARAIENQFFVLAASRIGRDHTHTFFGHSLIIDPFGNIIAEAGETEEIITAQLDPAILLEARKQLPLLDSRRPELYASLRKKLEL